MKKEKGFTLIELLAVIVILAILLVIAVPAVSNYITSSKKGSFISNAKMYIDEARKNSTINGTLPQDKNDKITLKVSELDMEKDMQKSSYGNSWVNSKSYIVIENIGSNEVPKYSYSIALEDEKGYCINLTLEDNLDPSGVKKNGCVIEVPTGVEDDDVELEPMIGEAYALILDNSANSTTDTTPMWFVRSETPIKAGDEYNGLPVKAAYTGFETNNYGTSGSSKPWMSYREKITSVVAKNRIQPISMYYWFDQFMRCTVMDVAKIDTSKVTNMTGTFWDTGRVSSFSIIGLDKWNVSNVESMSHMFSGATSFNQPIGDWDVSKVKDMSYMFFGAKSFNQPIENWNVSNVKNMQGMFWGAKAFNQSIGDWDVSNVTDMCNMFLCAEEFNQPIGDWDVSNATNMSKMFDQAASFNQPIGDWDVSKVENMDGMFDRAYSFNQPIGDWDVSKVKVMTDMFYQAESFNQPIGDWDVSNVKNMYCMFQFARAFNQPIGDWDVSNVIDMRYMFYDSESFNQDLSNWQLKDNCKTYSMYGDCPIKKGYKPKKKKRMQ